MGSIVKGCLSLVDGFIGHERFSIGLRREKLSFYIWIVGQVWY